MRVETGVGLGKIKHAKYNLFTFDNLDDYLNTAKSTPREYAQTSAHVGKKIGRRDFFGCDSFNEAVDLATNGWRDCRSQVEGFLTPIRERLSDTLSIQTVRVHDMVGFEPDIDRYLANETDCMWDDWMQEERREGRVFTLLVDASMVYDNAATDILKRGATLCALVEAYTMLGYQLEIWVEQTVGRDTYDNEFCTYLTPINRAGEPLDINRVMFAIGHSDYNRRLGWRIGEGIQVMRERFGFNGSSYGINRRGIHFAQRVGANSTVVLDGNRTMLDSETWILNQLEEQGLWDSGEDTL